MREAPYRILVIDDNPSIHEDFRKILCGALQAPDALSEAEAILFGATQHSLRATFIVDSAYQGQDGVNMVEAALAEGRPYAMAFIDVRMPPGWDGVETITRIWQKYPELQVVVCTAYSDYSWDDMIQVLGHSDNLVILKKPFDNIEVLQLAHALSKKWVVTQQARVRMDDLDRLVAERTAELEKANTLLKKEILERTAAEEALRSSQEQFAKAFHSNPLPMIIQAAASQRVLDVNESFLQATGFPREEVIGRTAGELGIWLDDVSGAGLLQLLSTERAVRALPTRLSVRTGGQREALVFAERFHLGAEEYILIIAEDISERLKLESQLRQAQKMEAVGQLAAGVAHDFNNILTVIQGHVSLRLLGGKLEENLEKSLTMVLAAAERATTLTRQLLAFSRKQVMQRRPVDVGQLLGQMSHFLERLIGEHIHLECRLGKELPPILADPCNIEQVILNLCVNARDAMPNGGRLVVSAEAVHIDQAGAAGRSDARPGHFVCLSVTDTGCGMDEATQAHIFEPFFTTKEVGKGTGMGLATVYGIVKQHNGWIEMQSQVGAGTTFKIFLPLAAATPALETDGKKQTDSSVRGSETILVVEDEIALRDVVHTVLQSGGYQVVLARDGVEALELWTQWGKKVDLLLTDLVMPCGINGRDLAARMTEDRPDLRVIVTSGYSADAFRLETELPENFCFLQKPYQARTLLEAVRQSLDSRKHRGVTPAADARVTVH